MKQGDFQELIHYCYSLANKLLIEQDGEFYPVGALIDRDGELKGVAYKDEDEYPPSQTVIDGLKRYFENELANHTIRSYAIGFDVLVRRTPESEKTDAIAIECYSKESGKRVVHYFPYRRLTSQELKFGDSWEKYLS